MLPTPEIRVWSSSCRLTPEVRRRTLPDERVVVELRVERVAGDVRDLRRQLGAAGRRPTARRTSAGRRTAARGPRRARRARTGPAGAARRRASGGWTSIWPLMPRWPSSASPLSSGSQRYLPRRRAASIRRPVSAAAKPAGPRGSRRTGPRVQHLDAVMRGADDVALEAGADDLDLGQLGHGGQLGSGVVGGGVAVDGSRRRAADDLAVRRLGGGLLGFLLGPADAVAVEAGRRPGPGR